MSPGSRRDRLAQQLSTAYGEGLLSPATFAERSAALGAPVIAPDSLVGDLSVRVPRPAASTGIGIGRRLTGWLRALVTVAPPAAPETPASLLALDWSGDVTEILIGRDASCDIVLEDRFVSRRHVRLDLRDGAWVLRDLESHNGTCVNGVAVSRCRLAPGDVLELGTQRLVLD